MIRKSNEEKFILKLGFSLLESEEDAIELLLNLYPQIKVRGISDGYFSRIRELSEEISLPLTYVEGVFSNFTPFSSACIGNKPIFEIRATSAGYIFIEETKFFTLLSRNRFVRIRVALIEKSLWGIVESTIATHENQKNFLHLLSRGDTEKASDLLLPNVICCEDLFPPWSLKESLTIFKNRLNFLIKSNFKP